MGHATRYAVGQQYEHDGPVVLCSSGFHFCEDPLDIFGYYAPGTSRYAEIEADGVSEKQQDGDSKRVSRRLRIVAEIGLRGILAAAVRFRMDRVEFSEPTNSATGYRAGAQATGDQAGAQATGDRAGAQATGDQAGAQATGIWAVATAIGNHGNASISGGNTSRCEGCAIALGINGRARGQVGSWLTLAEWIRDCDDNWHRIDVRTARVDGTTIKPDVFYQLIDGRFVEVAG